MDPGLAYKKSKTFTCLYRYIEKRKTDKVAFVQAHRQTKR